MGRHLPVIQTPSGEDAEAAERPAWQWLLIGAAFVLAVFVPLSLLAAPLGVMLARRVSQAPLASAAISGAPVLGEDSELVLPVVTGSRTTSLPFCRMPISVVGLTSRAGVEPLQLLLLSQATMQVPPLPSQFLVSQP